MYNYQQIYELMKKFYELDGIQVRIIEHLMKEGYVKAKYSELTEDLGFDKAKMSSNVRKSLIRLHELGIVYIVYKDTKISHPMEACYLVDNWMENLLNADSNEISKLKE